jgi:hypothetical protein
MQLPQLLEGLRLLSKREFYLLPYIFDLIFDILLHFQIIYNRILVIIPI